MANLKIQKLTSILSSPDLYIVNLFKTVNSRKKLWSVNILYVKWRDKLKLFY